MADYPSIVSSFLQGGGDANLPLRLRALQEQRAGELSDQATQDIASMGLGSPAAQAANHADVLSRFMKLKGLESDMAADPTTGAAAHQRQADTEKIIGDAYTFDNPQVKHMRDEALANTIKEKVAPNEATVAGNLAVEQMKAKSASELQQGEQQFTRSLMGPTATDATGNLGVNGAGGFMMNIGPTGKPSFQQTRVPQQVQAQQHAAQAGLAQYGDIEAQILDAAKRGVTGPLAGPLRSWETSSGFSAYDPTLSQGDEAAAKQLGVNLSLLKSNLAYAHGAARGGASPGMQARFDPLFNTSMSPSSLAGSLAAARKWLTGYAAATNNFTRLADPAHLAQLDQALGLDLTGTETGGASPVAPGGQFSGPGWQ